MCDKYKGHQSYNPALTKTASQKHPLQKCCAKEIKLKSLDVKAGVFPYEVCFHFNET